MKIVTRDKERCFVSDKRVAPRKKTIRMIINIYETNKRLKHMKQKLTEARGEINKQQLKVSVRHGQ